MSGVRDIFIDCFSFPAISVPLNSIATAVQTCGYITALRMQKEQFRMSHTICDPVTQCNVQYWLWIKLFSPTEQVVLAITLLICFLEGSILNLGWHSFRLKVLFSSVPPDKYQTCIFSQATVHSFHIPCNSLFTVT